MLAEDLIKDLEGYPNVPVVILSRKGNWIHVGAAVPSKELGSLVIKLTMGEDVDYD